MNTGIIPSPIGPLLVTMTGTAVSGIHFCGEEQEPMDVAMSGNIVDELAAYFAGDLREFTVAVDISAVSEFSRKVLEETARIPHGETRTYGEIARAIGMPGATQAVGNALGSNPVAVLVPCHRVIRSDGTLGGYAGGLDRKRKLLEAESSAWQRELEL